jgi:hypothetical protein
MVSNGRFLKFNQDCDNGNSTTGIYRNPALAHDYYVTTE